MWESVKHCYAFICTSLPINTQHEREHMATTRLSHTHNRLLTGGKNCMAWEPDTQTDISRLCVFRNDCLYFIFHRFPAHSVAPDFQGRPQTEDFIPDKCITSHRKEWTHRSLMCFKWAQVFWRELASQIIPWHPIQAPCGPEELFGRSVSLAWHVCTTIC